MIPGIVRNWGGLDLGAVEMGGVDRLGSGLLVPGASYSGHIQGLAVLVQDHLPLFSSIVECLLHTGRHSARQPKV